MAARGRKPVMGWFSLSFSVFFCSCPQLLWAASSTATWQYPDAATAWKQDQGTWRFLPVADRWEIRRSQQYPDPKWSVSAESGDLLTVIVPVKGSEQELGHLRNQFESMNALMDVTALREYLVIVPEKDLDRVKQFLMPVVHSLPNILRFPIRLVAETLCVPELGPESAYAPKLKQWPSWLKQQIVKLASVELVETPFVLILDADQFVGHTVHPLDLFETGTCTSTSPVCDTNRQTEYKGKIQTISPKEGPSYQTQWWNNTASAMQLDVSYSDWDFAMGVSPQVISADLAKQFGHWVQNRFDVPSWRGYMMEIALAFERLEAISKNSSKAATGPVFTEYSLLYTYGLHAGNFFRYHAQGQLSMGNEVHTEQEYKAWEPCQGMSDSPANGFFSGVQSHLQKDPDELLAKLQKCWQSVSPDSQSERLSVKVSKHASAASSSLEE